ncbi:MAG: hypothetical protein K8H88_08260 [Sandaracinaceae bacterium]|nr:hypothetical protein [Sandaracinaceae bacterium]
MTQDDDDRAEDTEEAKEAKGEERRDAPKERVLHTRVPAVLEQELKRLARGLRVPVSNVVRAILEDAIDAVDTVGERTEGELRSFVDRLHRQRGELRTKARHVVTRDEDDDPPAEPDQDQGEEAATCPEQSSLLDGVLGYQALVLATKATCSVCGRDLDAGTEACRAVFDEPGRKVLLGIECRLVPAKKSNAG